MKDGSDWRDKYLASVDKLEAEQRSWAQLDDVLRRLVRRLCIASRGFDSRLDVELARVTSAMRNAKDAADLESLLRDLTATVAALDEARAGPAPASARNGTAAPTPDPPRKAAVATAASAAATPAAPAAPGSKAAEVRSDASPAAAAAVAAPTVAAPAVAALTAAPAAAVVASSAAAGPAAAVMPAAAPDLAMISEPLLLIVERLGIAEDSRSDVAAVREALLKPVSAIAFENAVWQLGDLVAAERARLQREKSETERVLQQVTARLEEFATFLGSSDADMGEADRSGRELNEQVRGEIRQIGSSAQTAATLGELQRVVKVRLESIDAHLQAFRAREQQRSRVYRERADRMRTRVQQLERETATLEKSLVREQRLASLDALTGIPNRLAYDERILQEFKRWKRFRQPLSLVAWDLDRFKSINDSFGHKAGDKVLRVVGQLLRDKVRETDFVARYGGEEFVMLLVGTLAADAMVVAEGIRAEIGRLGFHFHGTPVSVTSSCGIAEIRAEDSADALFNRADKALYRAKEAGRNRCVVG